jgi:hypothetical protein
MTFRDDAPVQASMTSLAGLQRMTSSTKKADAKDRPEAFHHVGLLVNEPPSMAGLLFI